MVHAPTAPGSPGSPLALPANPGRMRAVTYNGYDPTPLHRIWRILTADFSLGTWFGVHVRMYWAAVILMPLLFLQRVPSASPGEALLMTAISFVGLFLIIWSHEMGHITAAWHYRIRTDKITLGPLGGLAHLAAATRTPKEDIVVSLAGPAVHFLWLIPLWLIEWAMPFDTYHYTLYGYAVWYLVTTNQVLLVFNLLPIFPLDGGRVLRAALALKLHPNRATLWAANIGIGGGILICISALTQGGVTSSIGFVIGLTCIMKCVSEKQMARHQLIYQNEQRDPWATDPDAWKRGGDFQSSQGDRKPGWFAQRRAARAEKLATKQRQEDHALNARVDEVLERVSKVGLSGLTDQEKKILQQASKKRKGAG